jgi:hypothetical protein
VTAKEWEKSFEGCWSVGQTEDHIKMLIADLAAAEEREAFWKNVADTADKHRMEMMADRDKYKEYATGGYCYFRDKWEERDRAEKAEASQTEFLKRCAALTIERDALREEVEDLRAYYEFQRSGWRVTGPAYDDLISRIETRRQQHGKAK